MVFFSLRRLNVGWWQPPLTEIHIVGCMIYRNANIFFLLTNRMWPINVDIYKTDILELKEDRPRAASVGDAFACWQK